MKTVPIKTKKKTQNNEGLASGLVDLTRDIASTSKSSGYSYKDQKKKFVADFKAMWKDWWNKRKDIDLTQDSEQNIEQQKRDERNEKRREQRKNKKTVPSAPTPTPTSPSGVPLPVVESKKFLDKSIMSESEYNKLNQLFENIIHIEEDAADSQYKAMMMNNFIQQVYPAIWAEIEQPRNKAQYSSELMKWANSGFFSIGALDNFIEFLLPFNSKGFQAQMEKERSTPRDDRSPSSPYVKYTREEIDSIIDNITKEIKSITDTGSPEYKEKYLILDALKHYKNTVKTS